jgi:hypothetical protein
MLRPNRAVLVAVGVAAAAGLVVTGAVVALDGRTVNPLAPGGDRQPPEQAGRPTDAGEPVDEDVEMVPSGIADDCSVDVTGELLAWIGSVPDGSTLRFGPRACYRVDGSLRIEDRHGLTFEGNGATFRAVDEGGRDRRHWWFVGGGDLVVRNLTVEGANPEAGTGEAAYDPDRAFQHAFALQGVDGAELRDVEAYDVYGDFVYIGPETGGEVGVRWSEEVVVADSTFARNGRQGIATVAGRDVELTGNELREVRRAVFNFEPTGESWGAEEVLVEGNTTGRARLLWLSSGGQGSNVSGITVRGNTMRERSGVPVIAVRTPEGHERGPVTVVDNDFVVDGSPAPAFEFRRVREVAVEGNTAQFPARREMTAVQLHEVTGATITRNRFCDAADVVSGEPRAVADTAGNRLECEQ